MSFPGRLLKLQIVERTTSEDENLSFLKITNCADLELGSCWRLYFSLGLTPAKLETRVKQTIIDGRYGYIEPAADWRGIHPNQTMEIPIESWLFTHMPAQGKQGFHLLSWEDSPENGSLTLPECLPPILMGITTAPNSSIRSLSPSCDMTPDTAHHRYVTNDGAYTKSHFTIVPKPERLVTTGDKFKISALDFDDSQMAKVLKELNKVGGLPVNIEYVSGLQGYELTVSKTGIEIKSGSAQSTFYAAHTLRQLINEDRLLQPCIVSDKADFEHRGLFIDLARHFHCVSDLKTIIQAMAAYKMNRLQLGISNDEGWRLEISELEELTDIGARRRFSAGAHESAEALNPSWGDGPEEKYEFISRAQFLDLLRFADHHHVEIIVEFNLPAHANALIRSIEARGRYKIIDPEDTSDHLSAQGYKNNIVNICMPDTYRLAKTILSAIADYYKAVGLQLKHIHLGGDELPAGAWLGSPVCHHSPIWQNSWNLDTEHGARVATQALKKHYVDQVIAIVHDIDPHIKIGFWHEMSDALPERVNAYITGWTTETPAPDLIDDILERRQELVIANASFLYLDMPYSLHAEEPGLPWAAYVSTQRIHDFDPLDCWKIKDAKNTLGLQAQLWTETVLDQQDLHYFLFPRLLAVADRAWRKKAGEWADFAAALGTRELAYLDSLKIAYRIPPPGTKIRGNKLKANLSYPGLTIRYNTNGEDPSPSCPILDSQLDVNGIKEIRLATFSPSNERSSRIEIFQNLRNASLD